MMPSGTSGSTKFARGLSIFSQEWLVNLAWVLKDDLKIFKSWKEIRKSTNYIYTVPICVVSVNHVSQSEYIYQIMLLIFEPYC